MHNFQTIDAFKNAMSFSGVIPPDTIIGGGKLHKFKIDCRLAGAAEIIRSHSRNAEIIIYADNDASGIGEQKARQAAIAADCKYTVAPMLDDFSDIYAGSI
jgi:phage/plasmid primase-like uncharacterized protein